MGLEDNDGPGWVDPAKDDRPDDREDDTDRAIKLARAHCIEAMQFLIHMMSLDKAPAEERVRAATVVLEVAGCL